MEAATTKDFQVGAVLNRQSRIVQWSCLWIRLMIDSKGRIDEPAGVALYFLGANTQIQVFRSWQKGWTPQIATNTLIVAMMAV